jgi:hypothetical protein
MVDINNNSFIGWLPGVPNVERLLTVQETCFQIERVIGAFEHLRSLEKKHHIQVILPIHQDMYALEANPLVINDVQNLLAENNKLHELWQHWVRLIKKYRFNKQKKLMA